MTCKALWAAFNSVLNMLSKYYILCILLLLCIYLTNVCRCTCLTNVCVCCFTSVCVVSPVCVFCFFLLRVEPHGVGWCCGCGRVQPQPAGTAGPVAALNQVQRLGQHLQHHYCSEPPLHQETQPGWEGPTGTGFPLPPPPPPPPKGYRAPTLD